ncbi:NAD(P)H-hydrate dehydratase [Blastococcus sp. TF02A-30]|uniref:NAD(P)H-hydrate dehydratase n=1 Tax=Blastococcus sp. TF02A-30 TaxID=2250580 RepID=UPI000DEB67F5|nr:NAD(P)H-hydrate dehydratase [Blastococcus sp. TF02A-30]RBY92815.1 NAD(P)H-hydrate dehydratase [Blastococcus sp. TF02A-30]
MPHHAPDQRRPDPTPVTPDLLRGWALPEPAGDKNSRGSILVIGGSTETLGAVLLAAEAAMRAGAGKLQVATVASRAAVAAAALPEALVRALPETGDGAISPDAAADVRDLAENAGAVLIGPGMADEEATRVLGERLLPHLRGPVALDALGLAAVTADTTCLHHLEGRAVLTPNPTEMAFALHVEDDEVEAAPARATADLAERARVVVGLGGATSWIATPDGRMWQDDSGNAGLGVSGSGDVRAGITGGLLARGADPAQAAVWAAWLHGRTGERLASSVGRLGFLARELPAEVPRALQEVAP